ncbi:MAG: hypothetical protein KKF62_06430 [Bacteroidetes bacterium]|nr:hypothetical protein [Bacteroidota bacterium]MBU1115441.1 hypothetical protein [Bacteroidota bacterium]MBU1797584.1 hypothetical protein [Bacteroidota bacterium]
MNLLKKIIFVLLIFCFASFGQIKPGAKQISLSHSDIALCNDVYALFNNPAGLSQQNWREFSIYYSPSPFGINKLANSSAVYHEPTNYGSFAIAYSNYGFELYKENNLFVSYSKIISKNFFLGTTLTYRNLSIKNYGSDNAITIIIGGLAYLTDNLRIGFAIDNITHSSFGKENNQIPMIFNFGFSYTLLSKLIFNAAIEKDIDKNSSLRVGIDYEIIKYLNLRIGAMNEPSSFSAGLGINYSIFEIDYAVFNHQDLGFTHQIGITLQFGSDKSRTERIKEYLSGQ